MRAMPMSMASLLGLLLLATGCDGSLQGGTDGAQGLELGSAELGLPDGGTRTDLEAGGPLDGTADLTGDAATDGPVDAAPPDGPADATLDASPTTGDLGPADGPGPTADGGGKVVPGAGKSGYSCPAGAISVQPGQDVAAVVNGAAAGAVICIHGAHHASATLKPKAGQRLVGIGPDARISGGQPLSGWSSAGSGVWVYDGPLAAQGPNTYVHSFPLHVDIAKYQDDVFFEHQRMMRVLSLKQLQGIDPLPPGQAVTAGETGRFFFDYVNDRIYIDQDPTNKLVELSVLDDLLNSAADNITLQNLVLEQGRTHVIRATGGVSWTIEDCTIRFAHNFGVRGGAGSSSKPFVYRRTLITNNGQYGLAGNDGSWFLIEDCELSWNNICNYRAAGGYWGAGSVKFHHVQGTAQAPGMKLINMNSHHNVGDGFWTDIDNQHILVQGGRFHHNERHGYFHEISCDIEISGAELDHNGLSLKNSKSDIGFGSGLMINDSNNAFVHDNLVHDNLEGIFLAWWAHTNMNSVSCQGSLSGDSDISKAMRNNLVQNNTIGMCQGYSGAGGHTLASRQNQFKGNSYHVPTSAGKWWKDQSPVDWAGWQGGGHDTAGSLHQGCSVP